MLIRILEKLIVLLFVTLSLVIIADSIPSDAQKWAVFWQVIGSLAAAIAAFIAFLTTNRAKNFELKRAEKEDYANSVALFALITSLNSNMARLCSQPTQQNLDSVDANLKYFMEGCTTHPLPMELIYLVSVAENMIWFIYDINVNGLNLHSVAVIKYFSNEEMKFRNAKFALRSKVYELK
jgi:hypothetical protein